MLVLDSAIALFSIDQFGIPLATAKEVTAKIVQRSIEKIAAESGNDPNSVRGLEDSEIAVQTAIYEKLKEKERGGWASEIAVHAMRFLFTEDPKTKSALGQELYLRSTIKNAEHIADLHLNVMKILKEPTAPDPTTPIGRGSS